MSGEADDNKPAALARTALDSLRPELFWGERFFEAVERATVSVIKPSDGQHLITMAAAGPDDIDQAVQAAHRYGRESGSAGIEDVSEEKVVSILLSQGDI